LPKFDDAFHGADFASQLLTTNINVEFFETECPVMELLDIIMQFTVYYFMYYMQITVISFKQDYRLTLLAKIQGHDCDTPD